MTVTAPSAQDRLAILRSVRRIAIVGASNNPARASYFVASYLQAKSDYELFFVNPMIDELLGQPVYKSLADLPETPDMVDVFRKHADLPAITDEAIASGASVLWFQLGLVDDASAQKATDAGLQVVQDRCIKIEHARFCGGLHLAGFDTGQISARRNPDLS